MIHARSLAGIAAELGRGFLVLAGSLALAAHAHHRAARTTRQEHHHG